MAQPSYGLGQGMNVTAAGLMLFLNNYTYAGFTLTNTGSKTIYVMLNTLLTSAYTLSSSNSVAVSGTGNFDLTSPSTQATYYSKFKTVSAANVVNNGIQIPANSTLSLTGSHEQATGQKSIASIAIVTAGTDTSTVTGGSTNVV